MEDRPHGAVGSVRAVGWHMHGCHANGGAVTECPRAPPAALCTGPSLGSPSWWVIQVPSLQAGRAVVQARADVPRGRVSWRLRRADGRWDAGCSG